MIQLPPLLLESTSQEACMNEGHPLTFKVHFHILCLQACCKSLRIGGSGGCGRTQRTEARSCCVRAGKEAFVLAREQPWQHAWSLCAPWKFIHVHRCSTNRTQSRSRSAPRQETHGCHGEAVLISLQSLGFLQKLGLSGSQPQPEACTHACAPDPSSAPLRTWLDCSGETWSLKFWCVLFQEKDSVGSPVPGA